MCVHIVHRLMVEKRYTACIYTDKNVEFSVNKKEVKYCDFCPNHDYKNTNTKWTKLSKRKIQIKQTKKSVISLLVIENKRIDSSWTQSQNTKKKLNVWMQMNRIVLCFKFCMRDDMKNVFLFVIVRKNTMNFHFVEFVFLGKKCFSKIWFWCDFFAHYFPSSNCFCSMFVYCWFVLDIRNVFVLVTMFMFAPCIRVFVMAQRAASTIGGGMTNQHIW